MNVFRHSQNQWVFDDDNFYCARLVRNTVKVCGNEMEWCTINCNESVNNILNGISYVNFVRVYKHPYYTRKCGNCWDDGTSKENVKIVIVTKIRCLKYWRK
jgi:hypothetical protein